MVLIVVLLSAVIAIKLGHMEQRMNRDQDRFSKNFEETMNNPRKYQQASTPDVLPIQPHTWADCPGTCNRSDFPTSALLILSMDGFSREYLDRYKLSSFNYLAKCGATAERVYPSFPSRTFPNHYTIVTGLYPESHGIVDNSIYDESLSDTLQSMKTTKNQGFYQGDPIWNVYKRYGGRTACLFWPGCAYNISGLKPDINVPYNKSLPIRQRFDMIVEWLRLPLRHRPGLITAYIEEPDSAGHYQTTDKDIESTLLDIDNHLWYLIKRLRDENLLNCVNLAVVSDHGMQKVNFTPYFSDMLNNKDVLIVAGAVSRLHKYKSDLTVEQLMNPFQCQRGDKWKVYDRESMATRKHYQKTPRVGDVVVRGQPGTRFYKDESTNYNLTGDHGYDYINPTMHTIFYAMGPSIKKGSFLPAFQNIEYMNLWLNLLGLPESVPNNGTLGIMDRILVHAPFRPTTFYSPLPECPITNLRAAEVSQLCSSTDLEQIERLLSCALPPQFPFEISSVTSNCFQNYCEKLIISGTGEDDRGAVVERLARGKTGLQTECVFANRKYASRTNKAISLELISRTLSADRTGFANISPIVIPWRSGFVNDVLDPLNAYTRSLVDRFGQLFVVTGTAYDYNYDGIADKETRSIPSHLYRVVIACLSGWSSDGSSCLEPYDAITLSFIFPHIEKDVNCLIPDDLLLEYTARLLDVELISGLRFQFTNLSNAQLLQLKTHIDLQLW
ncbi:hypothetical protein KIN20_016258 [Parelaphostrongylus tenuis]|uniref:ENPP1-3/EXOG-like endonuclease/phosphodiesterase domain-containing protein n=1 Tax=Parelaphostrongylus tenuis TaxID=148309 RepID=A0AAD5MG67_PARTN|nr:hypothetical protein KIN20_016258 [Parelaphostrongylus tenuis]